MDDFHPTGEGRGAKANVLRAKEFMLTQQDAYVALTPDLAIPNEQDFAVNFSRAIMQAHMWDTLVKDGNMTKYYDVKKLEKIDGVWTGTEIHMTTKKGRDTVHKTILIFSNVRYNQDQVNEEFFTIRNLEKGP